MGKERTILHVDMDSFFVSVALLHRPDLIGVPAAVGGSDGRGVITSATYEARTRGVKCAMPVVRAKRVCPELVLLPLEMAEVRDYSRKVMQILGDFTPQVEVVSIDEAYLDVTGSLKLFGSGLEIAQQIRARIRSELSLPASVGVGSLKTVAKLASKQAKPDGIKEVSAGATLSYLRAMQVEEIPGVGGVTANKLKGWGIYTVAQVLEFPKESLLKLLGDAHGQSLWNLAQGIDNRTVEPERDAKSISNERTFPADTMDLTFLRAEILDASHTVAAKLRKQQLAAKTVSVKLKWHNFETVTRSLTLPERTDSSREIYTTALTIFNALELKLPVRLLGVKVDNLGPKEITLGLWESNDNWQEIDGVLDSVRDKFGSAGVKTGRLLGRT